jgi:hypothetical protein
MDDLRPHGPGRLVLQALAIVSALGFLALLMVQAMAFYAPPPEAAKKSLHGLIGPATKAAPVLAPELVKEQQRERLDELEEQLDLFPATKAGSVVHPPRTAKPEPPPPEERRYLLPATKAGILGPLKLSRPDPPRQPQGTPQR